ncbi:MAG: SDR family NAD(P)-dependent oxidoreductase [Oscillospiraceae bacterium]
MEKKTVIITGGTGGIGSAMARVMAKRGHRIVITYVVKSEQEQAEKLLAEIKNDTQCEGLAIYTDVSDYAQCEELARQAAAAFGSIDVLANNAGIACAPGPFHEMDIGQVEATLNVNLKGVMYCTRAVLPYMLKQEKGCIVNTASIAGLMATQGNAEYSASKAGVIGFTRSIAADYALQGVRCNAIAPGVIETPMTAMMDEAAVAGMGIPMGRMGQPEDIADALDYIVHAEYLTGQTISPNGGLVMP